MQTTDTDLLFQSTQQLNDAASRAGKRLAAADIGRPILTGKIIDFLIVGNEAFVAESGWQARQLDLAVSRMFVPGPSLGR
jgi:hypothetical protein